MYITITVIIQSQNSKTKNKTCCQAKKTKHWSARKLIIKSWLGSYKIACPEQSTMYFFFFSGSYYWLKTKALWNKILT